MKVTHITVKSVNEAWSKANEIFPTDYEQDSRASKNAGYPIYWSTLSGCAAWISDLGNRLEVNLQNGDTVEIWIEEEENEIPEEELNEAVCEEAQREIDAQKAIEASKAVKEMPVEALYAPEVCLKVTASVDGEYGSENEKAVYEAIKREDPSILFDLLTRYAESHGIKWGGIWGCRAYHINHGKREIGHYIVEGYISAGIKHELDFCDLCDNLLFEAHKEAVRGNR